MNSTEGSPRKAPRRAWRSPLAWVVLLTVITLGLAADLGFKAWSFHNVAPDPIVLDTDVNSRSNEYIPVHAPVVVIPRLLHLHLVKNQGAVFGIGADRRMFFIVFTFAALIAAFAVFGRWTTANATVAHIAIALIIAGLGIGGLVEAGVKGGIERAAVLLMPALFAIVCGLAVYAAHALQLALGAGLLWRARSALASLRKNAQL